MSHHFGSTLGCVLLIAGVCAGCDRPSTGKSRPQQPEVPSAQELKRLGYLPSETGPDGHKVYKQFAKARNCGDFELAMRWDRPPNIDAGPFAKRCRCRGPTLQRQ